MERRFFFLEAWNFRIFHLLQDILIELDFFFLIIVDNHIVTHEKWIGESSYCFFLACGFKQTTPLFDELDEIRYHLNDYLTIRTDLLLYNVEII